MELTEVVENPGTLSAALREVVKLLDIGDQVLAVYGNYDPTEDEVQRDLLAVADLLESTEDSQKLDRYIWRHRYLPFNGEDDYDDD